MIILVALLAGLVTGRLLWIGLHHAFQSSVFLRTNYAGHVVPTAVGVVLPLSLLAVEAGRTALGAAGVGTPGSALLRTGTLIAVLGFSLLGLLDDLAGDGSTRGFRGHIDALGRGRLTTGGAKLIGGGLVAAIAASAAGPVGFREYVVDVLLVALAANLANLFDLRPGRVGKISLIAFVVLIIASRGAASLSGVAVVVGAGLGLLLDDVRERLMLGDVGSNAIGAALGVGVIISVGAQARLITLIVLMALNVASEFVSFSKLFESFFALRAFDALGRRTPRSE